MAFRGPVGGLERSIVCSHTNVQNMQVVEAQHVQFVLRKKDIGRVRVTSSTTQTCVLKNIMVFFEVACNGHLSTAASYFCTWLAVVERFNCDVYVTYINKLYLFSNLSKEKHVNDLRWNPVNTSTVWHENFVVIMRWSDWNPVNATTV